MKKPNCEECKKNEVKYSVYYRGSSTTLMGWSPYWDEDGKYHNNNPNKITSSYECSNGHSWSETE